MWSITLNVILKKRKSDADLPEKVREEISEMLEKRLAAGDIDGYNVEIDF